MSLLAKERQDLIMQYLIQDGKVKVIPLADELGVTTETIRRDLDFLESEGHLRRVHGGAVRSAYEYGEPTFEQRETINVEGKQRIGEIAASLIQDGEMIALDVGTTMIEMVKSIRGKKNITVLTNSLAVGVHLSEALSRGRFTGKVIFLGGELNPEQNSITGPLCENMLQEFHLDKAFLSVGGVSLKTGITDYDINESHISKMFSNAASQTIVLADHSKIGVQAFSKIMPIHAVDIIVSDVSCPEDWEDELMKIDLRWIN
ncbi:DeoR/GlpR family DNA-binding transcription regulator [Paenibacillus glacialis]|uniref:DeoR family transcriptional regulator n=1 Tax=Paenibacillus glacialis TaxID=494026 RepID=A0A168JM42_9BACL|nr:DeoR/GlpR family DNA-binding transcription regulator [Paenibacillus glacialis]OAB40822.1 DeoR family transcriptional regulator [Paenibacillus glacialis]